MEQENIFTVERETILEILGIKNTALKHIIARKQLEDRLKEKGYVLLENFKKGRKTIYKIEEVSLDKFKLNNAMECIFNTTKDEDKHTDYIMYRCANLYKPLSKKHLAEKLGVNEKTIGKWDKHMVDNELLAKDGYFYVAMDFKDNDGEEIIEYRLTDKYEYNTFATNNRYLKIRNNAMDEQSNGRLSYDECALIIKSTEDSLKANYGKIVYKVSKYSVGKSIDLTKLIIRLIRDVWDKKLFDYILDYLTTKKKNKKTVEDYVEELVEEINRVPKVEE